MSLTLAPAIVIVRAALQRGPLTRTRSPNHWKFRRRLFSCETVNRALAEGSARYLDSDTIVSTQE